MWTLDKFLGRCNRLTQQRSPPYILAIFTNPAKKTTKTHESNSRFQQHKQLFNRIYLKTHIFFFFFGVKKKVVKDETIFLSVIYLFIAEIFLSVSYTRKNVTKMAKYHFLLKYIVFLPLFEKYLTIYHSFKLEFRGNWVNCETRVLRTFP